MADGKCDYPMCQQPFAPQWPDAPKRFCTDHMKRLTDAMLSNKPEALKKFWSEAAGGDDNLQTISSTAAVLQSAVTMQFIEDAAHMKRGPKLGDNWDVA